MTHPTDAAIAQAFREAVACFQPSYLPFARLDVESVLRRARELDAERGGDANVEAVRAKLLDRSRVGFAKYGVTTERTDLSLSDWLTHLQEELMDAAVYVEAAKRATPSAQAAEAVLDKARMDWLSENFVFADFDYGHDHESILGIQWPKGLAVSAGLRRNVDAAIAAMQGVDRG